MKKAYVDILRTHPERPIWWSDGVPRYEPFKPDLFQNYEVALVRTQCQDCKFRYDVAVTPYGPHYQSLKTVFAYLQTFEVGDPPLGCPPLKSGFHCSGYTMGSEVLEILEFWQRPASLRAEWIRDSGMERTLFNGRFEDLPEGSADLPVMWRLLQSKNSDEWRRARETGNFELMVHYLRKFGCARPAEVAHMLDIEDRHARLRRQLSELSKLRLGS